MVVTHITWLSQSILLLLLLLWCIALFQDGFGRIYMLRMHQDVCVKFMIIFATVSSPNRNFHRWKWIYISYQSTHASEGQYAVFTCNKQFRSISDHSWWGRKRHKPRQFRIKTQVFKERLVGDRQVHYLWKQNWLRSF